jgi:hypothetical protein
VGEKQKLLLKLMELVQLPDAVWGKRGLITGGTTCVAHLS